jgi:hypothetical protein
MPPSQNQSPARACAQGKKATGKQAAQTKHRIQSLLAGSGEKNQQEEYEEIEAIFRQQGVLTPRNTLIVEPSFQFAYSSSTR